MYHSGVNGTCTRILRAPRGGRWRRMRGFTLIELMIAVAVAAILLVIAVPSFKHVIASSKLTSTANTLVNALHVARMQAIKRNADAQFCSNDAGSNGGGVLGAACGSQVGAVYVEAVLAATNTPFAKAVQAPTQVVQGQQTLVGPVVALRFDPQGVAHKLGETVPYTGDIATICTSAMDTDNGRVVHMVTGTVIDIQPPAAGVCP